MLIETTQGLIADRIYDDPCVQVLAFAGGFKPDLRQALRSARAKAAREIGWASPDATDAQALQSLKGQTGRARLLKRAVHTRTVPWRPSEAFEQDLQMCMAWVQHLLACDIQGSEDFAKHLECDLHIGRVDPEELVNCVGRTVEYLAEERLRHPRRQLKTLGREALAQLRFLTHDAIKQRDRRGDLYTGVHVVWTDGNELDQLCRALALRKELEAKGSSHWRRVQRAAKERGLTTDEYLREMVGEAVG